jgi:CheY-like chemotaxis protein
MMQPVALLVYEVLLPGSQLVNRLRELGYRVVTLSTPAQLAAAALEEKPMIILVDLDSPSAQVADHIVQLRAQPDTAHIPVIAFAPLKDEALQEAARQAGATLVAVSNGIHEQLPALLSQALEVE